jgi:1-deoxy-D-xylulose-5-phosphate reductoisomerase
MVHSMVEYEDGSILAQLGQPDMRTPIAYGLGFPDRIESGVGLLALTALGRLDFEEPNFERFPCLRLSFDALRTGQAACVALNAANEVAVDCFLKQQIRYTEIARIIETCLDRITGLPTPGLDSLAEVLALDAHTRSIASELCLIKA